jgi:DNA-directed RNA polymerase subunit beta'
MSQTFAQYLINKGLPAKLKVDYPLDKKALNTLLSDAHAGFPDKYPDIVMHLKRLGNKFSTYETQTMGLDEIDVPNREARDKILSEAQALLSKATSSEQKDKVFEQMQARLAENDLKDRTDSATEMVVSGGLGGKRTQLMKLRTTPGVTTDAQGKMVHKIVNKSYSEGLNVRDTWLQAIQGRKAFQDTQLSTAAPGELSKVMSNLLNSAVVSTEDCGTRAGIYLFSKDEGIIDRYLAKDMPGYPRNTLVTPDVQQALLKAKIPQVLVRSPQTCQGKDGSVCAKCMGLRISTGKPYEVGDNAGMISAGILGQDVTQLALSSKHGNATAKGQTNALLGEKGLRTFVESPKVYPNKQVLCELYGTVHRILKAPQGGWDVTIRETKKVPERYILYGKKVPKQTGYWQYYVPPQRKILDEVKQGSEVYPGMALTDGNVNLRDTARLGNLGVARSQAAEGMYKIYKDTGVSMDRRHLELLSRNTLNQVKIEKSPKAFPFKRGEVVDFNTLQGAVDKLTGRKMPLEDALGLTLTEGVHAVTPGTELTRAVIDQLRREGVKDVKVTGDLETSAVFTPMTRSLNNAQDKWLSKMNHRYISTALKDAAAFGEKESIHGYSPMASYAYGSEFGMGKDGRY